MDGIRFINVGEAIETLTNETAKIKIKPVQKYRYDEDNPINPVEIDRIGRYYADELEIELVLGPGDWSDLMLFLGAEGTKYVEFEHDELLLQYPLTRVIDYPECGDDQHEYEDISTLRIESRYYALLPIDFNSYIFSESLIISVI